MNILFLCNEYPPNKYGGIGTFTRDIAKGLVRNGHKVTVWGLYSDINKIENSVINGINVIREIGPEIKGRGSYIWFIFCFWIKIKIFLSKNPKFDIVECQEWLGLLPFGLKNQNLVIRIHGASVFFDKTLNRKGNRLTHFFEKMTMGNANNLIAVSNYCGEKTLKLVNLKSDYKTIYNSVNIEKISSYRKDDFVKHRIVFANSMLPKKGVLELSKAFNLIASKYEKSEIFFIGKLGYEKNGVSISQMILQNVEKKYHDRLKILGWLDSASEVYEYISTAHLCIYPSHMEGFGIAPVESMALSKPTIFMKGGPGPEVIKDLESGLLVDSTNYNDIAKKIVMIFEDPELSNSLSINGFIRSKKMFDLRKIFIPNNIAYYKSII
jgi:glycosyltransferase involved in cell wall biosynthesis